MPDIPSDLQRIENSEAKTAISIEWTEPYNGGSDITGYQVWWNAGGQGPINEIVAVIEGNTAHHTESGLVTGMYYGFAVKTITAIGMSDLST